MIQNNSVVSIGYILKSASGKELDQSTAESPFFYLHGHKNIVPGLENALEGLRPGDKKSVVVKAAEGYGEIIDELIVETDRSSFPADAELSAGMQFRVDVGGRPMVFLVESIEGDKVKLDGNHPLAGEDLFFEVEILAVRAATAEELNHGHTHGADGSHSH